MATINGYLVHCPILQNFHAKLSQEASQDAIIDDNTHELSGSLPISKVSEGHRVNLAIPTLQVSLWITVITDQIIPLTHTVHRGACPALPAGCAGLFGPHSGSPAAGRGEPVLLHRLTLLSSSVWGLISRPPD